MKLRQPLGTMHHLYHALYGANSRGVRADSAHPKDEGRMQSVKLRHSFLCE